MSKKLQQTLERKLISILKKDKITEEDEKYIQLYKDILMLEATITIIDKEIEYE